MEFASLVHDYQIVFQELYKLCIIATTFPHSVLVQWTFSCVMTFKTYLQNQMGNDHLSDSVGLVVESDMTKNLLVVAEHKDVTIFYLSLILNNFVRSV